MHKGQDTKAFIIEKAAELFNKNGYAGVAISDLMEATGLKKGGIYNHFSGKEDILIQAFNYSVKKYKYAIFAAYRDKKTAISKILAIIDFYESYAVKPIIAGGCPIVNTSVDADNTLPALKLRVRQVLERWLEILEKIIRDGQDAQEIRPELNAHEAAIYILTTIQGAILMTRTLEDNRSMETVIRQLRSYVLHSMRK